MPESIPGTELVRCSTELVEKLIADESAPVVVARIERQADGTAELHFRSADVTAELERLREALAFYAAHGNYDAIGLNGTVRGPAWRIIADNGVLARQALGYTSAAPSTKDAP